MTDHFIFDNTFGGSCVGEDKSPFLSSHLLSVVTCPRVQPGEIFPVLVSMFIDIAVVKILFLQQFL